MITQHQIDTITENLAAELSLSPYDHLALAEVVMSQLKLFTQLHTRLDELTLYPSRYFKVDLQAKTLTGRLEGKV